MTITTTARRWRVHTPDGEVSIESPKLVVTPSGALIALATDGHPAHIFRSWESVHQATQLQPGGPR